MILDEHDLREGLKFIVGTWQADYVVNAFSNDLSHIPAKEFKSDDGRDFSAITFEFFEDHTVAMRDASSGKEEKGTWEQTGWSSYKYTLNGFVDLPEGSFRDAAEKLEVVEGCLVFSIGFLAVGMKKTADGVVTEPEKEPDRKRCGRHADKPLDRGKRQGNRLLPEFPELQPRADRHQSERERGRAKAFEDRGDQLRHVQPRHVEEEARGGADDEGVLHNQAEDAPRALPLRARGGSEVRHGRSV